MKRTATAEPRPTLIRTARRRRPGAGPERRWLRRFSRALGWWAGLVVLCASLSSAHAAPTAADKASAEVLFEEGRKLVLAGNYDEACEKFEASQRLDAGIGTLLYLADAYEKAGRTASAWVTFREAAALARTGGQPDRETIARDRAAILDPKLSYLLLTPAVSPDPPGFKVTRDKVEVSSEVFGIPIPMDPGTYAITVSAPGKKPWASRISVPREPGTASLTLPELVDASPTPVGRQVTAPPGPAPSSPDAAPSSWGTQRVIGVLVGGVGLAGLGVGSVFVAKALERDSAADVHCDGARCQNEAGVDLSREARKAADVASVAFGVGGALLAGGVVLLLTAPSGKAASKKPGTGAFQVTPLLGPSAGGFAVGGRF